MASGQHGTLYIGVTSELLSRVAQHREGLIDGFTKRYGVKRLVWFETHDSIVTAIQREKSLKKYKREYKQSLRDIRKTRKKMMKYIRNII